MPVEDERRRQFLLASGVALTSGLAGCNGYLEDDSDGLSGNETETTTAVPQEIDLPVDGEAEWVDYGETVSSELSQSSPRDDEYGGYYEPWTFTGREGHYVTASMESDEGDTYLYLLNEAGELLTENDDDGSSLNSRIYGYELPETGAYVLLAGSYSDGTDFQYDLSLREGVEGEKVDLREISVGATETGRVDAADPYNEDWLGSYEPVTVQADSSQTVDISATGDGGFYLVLTNSNDEHLASGRAQDGSDTAELTATQVGPDTERRVLVIPMDDSGVEYELTVEETTTIDLRSIDVGETETGQIDGSDPQSNRFNGYYEPVTLEPSTDQAVDIEMTSENGDTYLYLLDSRDNVIARNDDGGRGLNSALQGVTLEGGSEYTVIATSYSSRATFRYQLSVQEGTAQTGADLRSIQFGETARGEIDQNDPESNRFRGYYEPVAFNGDAGQTVTIDMTSDEGDTYLMLVDPNANVVAQNDDGGSGLNSSITGYELQTSGQYFIVATSYRSRDTFEYQLSLSEGGSGGGGGRDLRSIQFGETARGEIDQNDPESNRFRGYYEPVAFNGDAGQTVTIDMTSDEGDTYLMLVDPNANVVAQNDDGGSGLNSSITGYELQTSGEYYIVATSYSSRDTFEYQLSLSEGGSGGGRDLRSIQIGETARGEIDQNDPQSSQYRGYIEPVSFQGEAGQTVDIEMTSDEGDTYLFVVDPDGNDIAEDDDGGSGLNSAIRGLELQMSGQYYIVATSYRSDATFEYELSLTRS